MDGSLVHYLDKLKEILGKLDKEMKENALCILIRRGRGSFYLKPASEFFPIWQVCRVLD